LILHLTNDIAWADGAARFVFGQVFVQKSSYQEEITEDTKGVRTLLVNAYSM